MSVQTTDIPPKEIVTYAKQTQTVASPERGGMVHYFIFFTLNSVFFNWKPCTAIQPNLFCWLEQVMVNF